MAENSAIEWTDHTFNPWEGCQKVGPGCDHCYAETRNARFGGGTAPNWGPGALRRRTSPANWRKPLAWEAAAERFAGEHGRRQRVFCASLADVFDNAVSPEWRRDLFDLIDLTPSLDWLLLTKRIGNVPAALARIGRTALPPHVWLGATVVNQAEADRDVPKLLATPATIRFLSIEPLLGPIDLEQAWHGENALSSECWGECAWCEKGYPPLWNCQRAHGAHWEPGAKWRSGVDWVIVGGESGREARPMHPFWVQALRDQCAEAGVPFLFKQWGEWAPGECATNTLNMREVEVAWWFDERWLFETADGGFEWHDVDEPDLFKAGKKAAGRLLDGVRHNGVPA